jgi:hypothetical protein
VTAPKLTEAQRKPAFDRRLIGAEVEHVMADGSWHEARVTFISSPGRKVGVRSRVGWSAVVRMSEYGVLWRLTEAGRKAVEPFEFCERCRGKADVRNCPDCCGTGRKAVGK